MSDVIKDLAKRGCKILEDTKAPRKSMPKSKPLQGKGLAEPPVDIHQAAVRKFVKDKPKKAHLIEFFERVIDMEEKLL